MALEAAECEVKACGSPERGSTWDGGGAGRAFSYLLAVFGETRGSVVVPNKGSYQSRWRYLKTLLFRGVLTTSWCCLDTST